MVNSIKDNLNQADTVSEIVLTLNHNKDNVCIVVEGEDDLSLFQPLLLDNVFLFQSYSGCIGVDNIVQTFFYNSPRVIGIRDRDYSSNPINNHCFFCDYCCAEMMIISIDHCFDRIYSIFFKNKEEMNSVTVRYYCLEHLEKLSKIRKLSFLQNWGICFDGIKPSKHYQKDLAAMNKSIVDELNRMNRANQVDSERELTCDALPKCHNLQDFLLITNGHDFVNLFCKVSTNAHGQASIKAIEAALRASFGMAEFKATKLYNDLITYQEKNRLSIV